MRTGRLQGKGLRIPILVIVLITLLMVTACAPVLTTTVEKKVVEIVNIAPLTGPSASSEQIVLQALQDYVNYFNEEKGIPETTINLLWADVGFNVPMFISAYSKFVDRGVLIFVSDESTSLAALKSRFERDEVPVISGCSTGPLVYPPGWIYCPCPTFGEASTAVIDYFMETWEEERPPRFAYICPDTVFGQTAAEEGSKYANSIGLDVLPMEIVPYVVIDASPQLLRLKDREADLVYIQNILPGLGPVLNDAERLGLIGDIQFGGLEFSLGETLISMTGSACEGYLTPRATPWFDETEIPGIKAIKDTQVRYHGKVRNEPEYIAGWLSAAIACESIKSAIEEVGYENIDRLDIKRALDSMTDFDVDGIAKISFTAEQRRGSRMVATYQIIEGQIVRVSDWREVPILVP